MVYAAKCYWPGVTIEEVRALTANLEGRHLGSLVFTNDDLVLCLFEASSRSTVVSESERVGLPCERVMESVWLPGRRVSVEVGGGRR